MSPIRSNVTLGLWPCGDIGHVALQTGHHLHNLYFYVFLWFLANVCFIFMLAPLNIIGYRCIINYLLLFIIILLTLYSPSSYTMQTSGPWPESEK